MFENGRTSVTDAERSGRPDTATTTRNEERTMELIRENRRITVEKVAGRLNVSVGSVYSLIHDSLTFSKVCTGWVPKELTGSVSARAQTFVHDTWPVIMKKVTTFCSK